MNAEAVVRDLLQFLAIPEGSQEHATLLARGVQSLATFDPRAMSDEHARRFGSKVSPAMARRLMLDSVRVR